MANKAVRHYFINFSGCKQLRQPCFYEAGFSYYAEASFAYFFTASCNSIIENGLTMT